MLIVLDTSVLYAGLRSAQGASRVILESLATGRLTTVLTPALFLEYEERLLGDPVLHAFGLTDKNLIEVLDDIAALSHRVHVDIRWRPVSAAPDDDMVIECAVNGQAEVLLTFNKRDLYVAHERFGISVLTPREFLAQFGSAV